MLRRRSSCRGEDRLLDLPPRIAGRREPEVLGQLLGEGRGAARQLAVLPGVGERLLHLGGGEAAVGEEVDVLGDHHGEAQRRRDPRQRDDLPLDARARALPALLPLRLLPLAVAVDEGRALRIALRQRAECPARSPTRRAPRPPPPASPAATSAGTTAALPRLQPIAARSVRAWAICRGELRPASPAGPDPAAPPLREEELFPVGAAGRGGGNGSRGASPDEATAARCRSKPRDCVLAKSGTDRR